MLFSSTEFLFAFLPCCILLYYIVRCIPQINPWAKNLVLLCGSLFFYAWGEPRFVCVMLLSIICNYLCGCSIGWAQKKHPHAAGAVLTIGIILNLGLLFVFKYLTFVLTNIQNAFSLSFAVPKIMLPIGISFFTFQSMSYLIDVWRKHAAVQKNPLDLALYVALFPQLIAGPIVRYETVAEQIKNRRESWREFYTGLSRFLTGLFKKVLLSNNMGLVADKAFSMNQDGTMNMAMAWLGAISYALQIFYDFSGYSDMAIGLGHMFGFSFEENFKYPYISQSITEFWRRWHISLGTWFRDYVYFPLGGSRVSSRGHLIWNLAVVWILTGIWHGAAWNFLLWGVWFFILLTVEKLFFAKQLKNREKHTGVKILSWCYAMLAVLLGWILFRAENLSAVKTYLSVMFGLRHPASGDTTALLFLGQKTIYFFFALLFCAPIVPFFKKKTDEWRNTDSPIAIVPILCDIIYPLIMLGLFLICVSFLLKSNYNPFIYFNF